MIRIDNLSAGYGSGNIINGISASADAGQLIVLLGPNGCGKSTLIKTLIGVLNRSSGDIFINGTDIKTWSNRERARQIAYLSQARTTLSGMSVHDVVELGRAPHRGRLGKISSDGQAAIKAAILKADIQDYKDRLVSELSGGEQARVLLARALAVDTPVLLADEPTAALDPFYQITMMQTLKAEAGNGKLVIVALHDLALAYHYADQIWMIKDGCLVQTGAPKDVLIDNVLSDVFGIHVPKDGFAIPSISDAVRP